MRPINPGGSVVTFVPIMAFNPFDPFGIDDRLASGIHDAECGVRLAIVLDGRSGTSDNRRFTLLGSRRQYDQ